MKKKLFTLFLSALMVCVLSTCAAANSDKEAEKDSEAINTEMETTSESEPETNGSNTELTDEQLLEAVYAFVCQSIITDYCEPNNIEPEDFVWPEEYSLAWSYFKELVFQLQMEGLVVVEPEAAPVESEKELMSITFQAIVEWFETNPPKNRISTVFKDLNTPYAEQIPEKIVVAEFEMETETETE